MDLWVLRVPAAIFKEGFYLRTFISYPKTHIPLLKVDKKIPQIPITCRDQSP